MQKLVIAFLVCFCLVGSLYAGAANACNDALETQHTQKSQNTGIEKFHHCCCVTAHIVDRLTSPAITHVSMVSSIAYGHSETGFVPDHASAPLLEPPIA